MTDALNSVYTNAIKNINENLEFDPVQIITECPAEDHPNVFYAAEYSHTTGGNVKTKHYNIRQMMPSTIETQDDFQNLFTRNMVIQIAEAISLEDKSDTAEYLAALLQHFVHDGHSAIDSIVDIKIEDNPKGIYSEDLIKKYKKECSLYCQPTQHFASEYYNWSMNGSVQLSVNGHTRNFHQITRKNIFLNDILKDQNVTPVLQHLIKLRIIHLCVSQLNDPQLKEHLFFKNADLNNILANLQTEIQEKIQKIIDLPLDERKKVASLKNDENRYSLSPLLHKLGQHISVVKLINGHASYDIHQLADTKLTFSQKLKFYLKSYTNSNIIEYLAQRLYKNLSKSARTSREFIKGQEKVKTLPFAFLKLMKSIYLMMWLPFLSAYFIASGLTSLPFSLLRKGLSISFGGKWDKALTGIEFLKDFSLIYIGLPIAFTLFTTIGTSILGTSGLSFGTAAIFYTAATLVSPFLLIGLVDHYGFKPGWYRQQNGVLVYREHSYNTETINLIKAISLNPLVAIHACVAASALIAFTAVNITGYALNTIKEFFSLKKCTKNELQIHLQNLNHGKNFKQLLVGLMKNLNENKCENSDEKLLNTLYQSQVAPEKKPLFENYFTQKIAQQDTPNKQTLTLAKMQLTKEVRYLPSWKLIDRLHTELSTEENPNVELRNEVERLYKIYEGPLATYR